MIETDRLIFREWREEDLPPFAEMNRDPRVMEYFPGMLSRHESDQMVGKIKKEFKEKGYGLWAVSVKDGAEFIGFIGLHEVGFSAPFTPAVEIGWRLAYDHWGNGYATEGAKAVLNYAFETLGLEEVVSFTTVENLRSRKVMEKIGLTHDPEDDFDHPKLAPGHPLRRHVLYKTSRDDAQA